MIGGMVLLNLSNNIINYFIKEYDYINYFKDYDNNDNKIKSKIIITQIFPDSKLNSLKIFNKLDIIEKINNIKVDTIQKAKRALTKFIKKINIIILNLKINIIKYLY